jgi:hypothetical protein
MTVPQGCRPSRGAMAPSQPQFQFPPAGNGLSGFEGCRLNTVWRRAVATPTLSGAMGLHYNHRIADGCLGERGGNGTVGAARAAAGRQKQWQK